MTDGHLVLVFDDGYVEDYEQLLPVLRSHGVPATLAIVPDWIGDDGHLDAEQLAELDDAGWEVLAHGRRHRYLQAHHLAADAESGDEGITVETGHVFPGEIHGTLAGDEYELTDGERGSRVTLTGTSDGGEGTVALEVADPLDADFGGSEAVLRPAETTLFDEVVDVREDFAAMDYDPGTFVFPYDAADARAWTLAREEYDAVANAAVRSLPNPPGTAPTNFRRYYLETTHSRPTEIETYLDHVVAQDGAGILAGHSAWESVPPERVDWVIDAAHQRGIEVTTFAGLQQS